MNYLDKPNDLLRARDRFIDQLLCDQQLTFTELYLLKTHCLDFRRQRLVVSRLQSTPAPLRAATLAAATDYLPIRNAICRANDYLLLSTDGGVLVVDDQDIPEEQRLPPDVLAARDKLITTLIQQTTFSIADLICLQCARMRSWEQNVLKSTAVPDELRRRLPSQISTYRDLLLASPVFEFTRWETDGDLAPFFLAEDGDVLTGDRIEFGSSTTSGRTLQYRP